MEEEDNIKHRQSLQTRLASSEGKIYYPSQLLEAVSVTYTQHLITKEVWISNYLLINKELNHTETEMQIYYYA